MLSSFVFIVNSCMYYVLSIVSIFLIYIICVVNLCVYVEMVV